MVMVGDLIMIYQIAAISTSLAGLHLPWTRLCDPATSDVVITEGSFVELKVSLGAAGSDTNTRTLCNGQPSIEVR